MQGNNGLSPDTITNFSKLLDQMEHVLDRQLEITEQVLKLEGKIATDRMTSMKQYFDSYSRALDGVARKQSRLGDGFLILSERIDKVAKDLNFATSGSEGGGGGQSSSKKGGGSNGSNGGRKNTGSAPNGGNNGGGGNGGNKGPTRVQVQGFKSAKGNVNDNASDFEEVDLGTDSDSVKSAVETKKKTIEKLDALTSGFRDKESNLEDKLFEDEKARSAALLAYKTKQYEQLGVQQKKLFDNLEKLSAIRSETETDREDRLTEMRLSKLNTVTEAEIQAQSLINRYTSEIDYAMGDNYTEEVHGETVDLGINEAGALRAKQAEAESLSAYVEDLDKKRLEYIAREERKARLKNNGELSAVEATRIQKEAAAKFKRDKEQLKKLAAEKEKYDAALDAKKERAATRDQLNTLTKGETTTERVQALKELTHNEAGEFDMKKTMTAAVLAVSDLAKQLESKIDEIGGYKKDIDTRLQGSNNKQFMGSYWDQLQRDMMSVGAVTPFFRQETFAENIRTLVKQGISFDLKQRAFLMTIQEKIANTFNVADGTLLRLIRIQQEDSTAGRLGMESALNAFLNEMYETSEYLTDVASSVRSSLEEMQALLKGADATEVEFQVQKWMGSLYSVGMSQAAVQAIASTFGQIAAGQVEGLTGGGAGNLLIMAANDAGIPIADMLIKGLDASDTNKLLNATVEYLAEIAKASEGNLVVQQQLADVFGVKASDLRAATNLVAGGSMGSIAGKSLTYDAMLSQLYQMAGTMFMRTSIGEMMTNIWENGSYSVASSMAGNPISYMIYKVAKVLDDAAGGIDLPFLNVMGFGVDLNTTVSDLMRLAAVGTGLLGSLGPMISGLASSFSGRSMLEKMGISSGSGLAVTPRGGGGGGSQGAATPGASVSESGYAGNSSGSDVKDSTIQESEDSKKQQMIEAKEEEEENQVDILNETVIKIYELLDEVANGKSCFTVKVEGYGLTKATGTSNAALAGLDSIANAANQGGGGAGGGAGGGSNAGLTGMGAGGSMTLGGWGTV